MKRRLTAVATAAAILAGGGLAYVTRSAPSTAAAFGGANPELWDVGMTRLDTGLVRCRGECRVSTSEGDDWRPCPLRLTPKASYAACLTALNAACVIACKSNPAPP